MSDFRENHCVFYVYTCYIIQKNKNKIKMKKQEIKTPAVKFLDKSQDRYVYIFDLSRALKIFSRAEGENSTLAREPS